MNKTEQMVTSYALLDNPCLISILINNMLGKELSFSKYYVIFILIHCCGLTLNSKRDFNTMTNRFANY